MVQSWCPRHRFTNKKQKNRKQKNNKNSFNSGNFSSLLIKIKP